VFVTSVSGNSLLPWSVVHKSHLSGWKQFATSTGGNILLPLQVVFK